MISQTEKKNLDCTFKLSNAFGFLMPDERMLLINHNVGSNK